MKTIKLLAATLLCAALPATINAQENLKKAINNFVNSTDINAYCSSTAESKDNDDNGKLSSFSREYTFRLPHDKMPAFDKVIAAFDKDKDKAYRIYSRNENMSDETLARIAYGDKLERSKSYGGYKNRNYRLMFVHDEQDSLRRHAYALTWWKDLPLGYTNVCIDEYYSLNPNKVETENKLYDDATRIITMNSDGSIAINDRLTGLTKVISTDIETDKEIKTSFDFVKRLGTLRAAFITPNLTAQTGMRTMIATKIAQLCNDHGDLPGTGERQFCIDTIEELKKHPFAKRDKYISGLFDIAIDKLRCVSKP